MGHVTSDLITPSPAGPYPSGEWTLSEPRRLPPSATPRHYVLFLLTVLTTTWAGVGHYLSFAVGFSGQVPSLPWGELVLGGFRYSLPILAILGAHEMGHFLACKYYGVDASAPYFLPMPVVLAGTLGAFIRIRQPFPDKRAVFDIGIAGPIAGFLIIVPALFIGMALSRVVELPTEYSGTVFELGEPLLFKAAVWLTFGTIEDGYTVNLHPMAFAAWIGMLVTALNLFPIAQLDGGHVSYAVFGPKSVRLTVATVAALVLLAGFSLSWVIFAGLVVLMLALFGPRHPRTYDEHLPLDSTRRWLAVVALVMFVLCFTPSPLELHDLVPGAQLP